MKKKSICILCFIVITINLFVGMIVHASDNIDEANNIIISNNEMLDLCLSESDQFEDQHDSDIKTEEPVLVKNENGTYSIEIDYNDQSISDKRVCSNQLGQTAELIYNKRDYSCWDLMLYSEDICNPKTISLENIYFSSVIDFDFLNENQQIVIIGHYSPSITICVIFDVITESFETSYATEFIVNHEINKIYYVNESTLFGKFIEVGELFGEVFYQSELLADNNNLNRIRNLQYSEGFLCFTEVDKLRIYDINTRNLLLEQEIPVGMVKVRFIPE